MTVEKRQAENGKVAWEIMVKREGTKAERGRTVEKGKRGEGG